MKTGLEQVLYSNREGFHPVVSFNPGTDRLYRFDFSAGNTELTTGDIADTERFSRYVEKKLKKLHALYGIGGYGEERVLYSRSPLFANTPSQTMAGLPATVAGRRSVHLGIDIWGKVGTPVFVPIGGIIHSFAFNDHFGDYGATIILQHQIDGIVFHSLFGHVSLADLAHLQPGKFINRGALLAHFGRPIENGWWPPHLHYQLIRDMELKHGDYPGVCTPAERSKYLANCPDPDLVLNMMQWLEAGA